MSDYQKAVEGMQIALVATVEERDVARAAWEGAHAAALEAMAERDRLRAALEPTEENLDTIEATVMPRALGQYRHIMRAILAAIRTRAGLP
jgi:uncharacterized coiled-coil DUF342 family protein